MKNMKTSLKIISTIILVSLTGCKEGVSGSGDNGSGNVGNKAATEAQAIEAIKTTWKLHGNDIDVSTEATFPRTSEDAIERNDTYKCLSGIRCALDPNAPPVVGLTARYVADENELIPVYYNVNPSSQKTAQKDPRFEQAMANINEVIGRPVFKDMGYIYVDHPVSESSLTLDYSSVSGQGGLIFSVGTSVKVDANQQSCGSASSGPNTMGSNRSLIDHNNYFQADKGWSWLNLDSSDGTCLADVEIATHELMHALGFLEHFDGFGQDGEVFGDRAKAALRTLYNNDAQLDPENLTYYHWPAK